MLILLAIIGIGFLSSTLENFPNHLLSSIFCFTAIILIILGVLNKKKNIIILFRDQIILNIKQFYVNIIIHLKVVVTVTNVNLHMDHKN